MKSWLKTKQESSTDNNRLNLSSAPTLVFIYNTETGWELKNIGNNPALDIIVAYQQHFKDIWEQPTRIYPLAPGEKVELFWVGHNPDKLGVVYHDTQNTEYNSICDEDLTILQKERFFPNWSESEILKTWQHKYSPIIIPTSTPTSIPTFTATPALTSTPVNPILRSQPAILSKSDVVKMIQEKGFNHPADLSKDRFSPLRIGNFPHKFIPIKLDEQNYNSIENVIIDDVTHLMWQQSGSSALKTYKEVQEYITKLNTVRKFAGYTDWRLPTIEELASLMSSVKIDDCYLSKEFSSTQTNYWSSDQEQDSLNSWVISFTFGTITVDDHPGNVDSNRYVKAVRTHK